MQANISGAHIMPGTVPALGTVPVYLVGKACISSMYVRDWGVMYGTCSGSGFAAVPTTLLLPSPHPGHAMTNWQSSCLIRLSPFSPSALAFSLCRHCVVAQRPQLCTWRLEMIGLLYAIPWQTLNPQTRHTHTHTLILSAPMD